MKTYHTVLTIAGSDSGGGAGIQADLKTFSALGCYGMSAITALTAQNTRGVTGIHPIPPAFVGEQIHAVLNDIGADAVKIGMLYSAELIAVVADGLEDYPAGKIVLDPVMAAQSGHQLIQEDAVEAIKKRLMPLCAVVTPNAPETELLTGTTIGSVEDMKTAARMISGWGCENVLVKGGHLETARCPDILYISASDRFVLLEEDRINTRNTHGTGCTLSSAVAAFLAKGENVEAAVHQAKAYVHRAIHAGKDYALGRGHGPVHHFFGFWS